MPPYDELLTALSTLSSPGTLVADRREINLYLTDWRDVFHGEALAVLKPCSTAEVADIVRLCAAYGVGVVPQGGNTGLAGGATPIPAVPQIVLSLARMDAIREVDPIGLCVEVEAGAILHNVQAAASEANRLLPIRIAAEGNATIGGLLSTNAGGVNVLRYGMTRELVLGLEVVLADGTVLNGLRRLRKDNAGQHWKHLFVGTEGSLGIVTAAVLRISPRPSSRLVALLSVRELGAALAIFDEATVAMGETITAFELISATSMELIDRHFNQTPPVEKSNWYLLVEFSSSLGGLKEAAEGLFERAFERGWAQDGVLSASESQATTLWALRERVTEAESREGRSLKHDISVPLSTIPRLVHGMSDLTPFLGPDAQLNIFGHIGDGNLHVNVILGSGSADPCEITRAVHDMAMKMGGSISAEHGLGQYRLKEWERLYPPEEQTIVTRLKDAMDPKGLLNPGKAVRSASKHEHLWNERNADMPKPSEME